jgi:hypothetical protein
LQSGRLVFLHPGVVEHCPQIADFGRLARTQRKWGFWRLSQWDKFIAGGGAKSHGERIDTEGVHLHAIDLNLFNSGAYESIKTGRKRNVGRRASANTEILDEMGLGGSSRSETERGHDGQCSSRSTCNGHFSWILHLWLFYNKIIAQESPFPSRADESHQILIYDY